MAPLSGHSRYNFVVLNCYFDIFNFRKGGVAEIPNNVKIKLNGRHIDVIFIKWWEVELRIMEMERDRCETVKKKLNSTYAFKIASGAYIVGLEKKHSYFFLLRKLL